MNKTFLLPALFFVFSLYASQEYTELKDVATTEGLPCSLIHQAVCVISGEYTDSALDVALSGPGSLTIHRTYRSFSSKKPWTFNGGDTLILGSILYQDKPSYIIAFRQPSSAQIDYIFEKKEGYQKLKMLSFKLIPPKGMTNGASFLSGKTNIKNQTLHFYPGKDLIVVRSGGGSCKTFKKRGKTDEGWPICSQLSEEKPNGSLICYLGKGRGISQSEKIICKNQESKKVYSSLTFKERSIKKGLHLQTITTSDERKLSYFFRHHRYKVKEKLKNEEITTDVDRFYLSKVDHPYAPKEKYRYKEKALSQDLHLTFKRRDKGKRFLNIDYYHKGINRVGGEVGTIDIKEKDDFRLDRVKKLLSPVGKDQTPIPIYRFDYHACIKKNKKDGRKEVGHGYTDVFDAHNHKTRYTYDDEHRLVSMIRYSGKDSLSYSPYTKESFFYSDEGWLTCKIFEDGQGSIHHARTFTYDSFGNVLTSALCGHLTGKDSSPLLLDAKGNLLENGYERQIKSYTYSSDGLNCLLSEKDSCGKTIYYTYYPKTDLLKEKFLFYEGKIQSREFYFYDENHALEKKITDDGCQESYPDLSGVTERHETLITPRKEAPVGLKEKEEELAYDFDSQSNICLQSTCYTYSPQGRLLEAQVFDANGAPSYLLKWNFDLHGNLISETNALGITKTKRYDLATDNLLEEISGDVTLLNTYDFANRLIEQKEVHPHQEYVTTNQFDYLGNCIAKIDPYGRKTKKVFDDFARVIEIHYPQVPKEGTLAIPTFKTTYDIAGFPLSQTDANGGVTQFQVNILGQPTRIIYPDGTKEERIYSLEGHLLQKIAKNGTRTEYKRDPLGRVTEEIMEGEGLIKKTQHRYSAFHLIESIDPEGNRTSFSYDPAGRLKEIAKNDQKIEHFYDSLGHLFEIREGDKKTPYEMRSTFRKYDMLGRMTEECLKNQEGETLHFLALAYDERGNQTFEQIGEKKTVTEYNSKNQPITITDGLGYTTHIEYNPHFINAYGQQVLQKITTDPLGRRTIETFDALERVEQIACFNSFGEKIAGKTFFYDLMGNQTQVKEEVIEKGKVSKVIETLFFYDLAGKLTSIKEAKGTSEQKTTSICYNAFGQKKSLIKPDGITIHYTYDAFERLKTLVSSDESVCYHYAYNLLDQATLIIDQKNGEETRREYVQGKLKKETLGNGLSLDYTYDAFGRALSLTFPDQTGMEYVYNCVDLKKIYRIIEGKRTYSYEDVKHSLSGDVMQAFFPGNCKEVTYHFDSSNRCTSVVSSHFHQHIPPNGFDAAGNLLTFNRQNHLYTFSYDEYDQIKEERGFKCHTYTFDSLENRTSKNGETSDYNALNQLVKKGEVALLYDPNGNLIQHGPYHYTYDALDRLIQVSGNGTFASYSYDAFDRRLFKIIGEEEELFLYQGQEEIGKWKNGVCQEIRLMGKNKQNPIAALEIQGTPYVPIYDLQGNIAVLLNLQGDIVEKYYYTSYGEKEILGPLGEKHLQSAIGNPWQYAGKRIDEESGLTFFGRRYFDPKLGRWISPDPLGFADGFNLYSYVHNNPLTYQDHFGLFADRLSPVLNGWFPFLEDNYQHFCSFLGNGTISDLQFGCVSHFNIEDKLKAEHNHSLGPFFQTAHYHINDLKSANGSYYSFKEMPEGKRIVFMCGIDNTYQDFKGSLLHLANLCGGYNVEGVFCPTFGLPLDYKCYEHALKDKACFEGTRVFQEVMQEFHSNQPPGTSLLAFFHSRGCVYGRNALIDLPQEIRNRVEAACIAPGAYIDPMLCKNVIHYVSTRDLVPKLDQAGRKRCQDTIILLQPHHQAPLHDHSFNSPTYAPIIETKIESYMVR